MQVDLTNLKEKEEELEYLSYHDQLTGIHNRTYFDQKLKKLDKKKIAENFISLF